MRRLRCHIGGKDWTLQAVTGVPIVPQSRHVKRPPEAARGGRAKTRNRWPWRLMQPDESLQIAWGYVTVTDIINSINGYCKNAKGASFCYRSTPVGLRVWCITQAERNAK